MTFHYDPQKIALGYFKMFSLCKSCKWKSYINMSFFLQIQARCYIIFCDSFKSSSDNSSRGLQAMVCAFYLEKVNYNQNFLNLHELIMEKGNTHPCDFLKQNFLHLQVKVISETHSYLINLCRMWAAENNMYVDLIAKNSLANTKENWNEMLFLETLGQKPYFNCNLYISFFPSAFDCLIK